MENRWKKIAIGLAVLPVAAIVFAWIGFFNIGASSGHWRVTNVVLHSAMRFAVKTYAFLEIEAPEQLPRNDIAPAAGHFARGCAGCHGAPGEDIPPFARRMLPPPPDLAEKVGEWTDAELFWIVKHGVRFTGMPAWPTQARDDEVWAMVAFLRELPAMDAESYRRLALGDGGRMEQAPRGIDAALSECSRCHGRDGSFSTGILPVIAGQNEAYLLDALNAYANTHRASGFMALPATASDPTIFDELARHFASQPSALTPIPANRESGLAADLVYRGEPARAIPACFGCHGDTASRNPAYPKIAGQPQAYLANQLRLFREGQRGGGPNAHLMEKAAEHLSDEDIEALAKFLGGETVQN